MEKITREQFMEFFRSDDFHEKVTDADCREIFINILKGQSDITPELLNELCSNYDTSIEEVIADIKIVILEDFGDDNQWRWYAITKNDTPQEALHRYWKDVMEEDGECYIEDEDKEGYFYIAEQNVRAIIAVI